MSPIEPDRERYYVERRRRITGENRRLFSSPSTQASSSRYFSQSPSLSYRDNRERFRVRFQDEEDDTTRRRDEEGYFFYEDDHHRNNSNVDDEDDLSHQSHHQSFMERREIPEPTKFQRRESILLFGNIRKKRLKNTDLDFTPDIPTEVVMGKRVYEKHKRKSQRISKRVQNRLQRRKPVEITLTRNAKRKLGVKMDSELNIIKVDKFAAKQGAMIGQKIIALNGIPVMTRKDTVKAMKQSGGTKTKSFAFKVLYDPLALTEIRAEKLEQLASLKVPVPAHVVPKIDFREYSLILPTRPHSPQKQSTSHVAATRHRKIRVIHPDNNIIEPYVHNESPTLLEEDDDYDLHSPLEVSSLSRSVVGKRRESFQQIEKDHHANTKDRHVPHPVLTAQHDSHSPTKVVSGGIGKRREPFQQFEKMDHPHVMHEPHPILLEHSPHSPTRTPLPSRGIEKRRESFKQIEKDHHADIYVFDDKPHSMLKQDQDHHVHVHHSVLYPDWPSREHRQIRSQESLERTAITKPSEIDHVFTHQMHLVHFADVSASASLKADDRPESPKRETNFVVPHKSLSKLTMSPIRHDQLEDARDHALWDEEEEVKHSYSWREKMLEMQSSQCGIRRRFDRLEMRTVHSPLRDHDSHSPTKVVSGGIGKRREPFQQFEKMDHPHVMHEPHPILLEHSPHSPTRTPLPSRGIEKRRESFKQIEKDHHADIYVFDDKPHSMLKQDQDHHVHVHHSVLYPDWPSREHRQIRSQESLERTAITKPSEIDHVFTHQMHLVHFADVSASASLKADDRPESPKRETNFVVPHKSLSKLTMSPIRHDQLEDARDHALWDEEEEVKHSYSWREKMLEMQSSQCGIRRRFDRLEMRTVHSPLRDHGFSEQHDLEVLKELSAVADTGMVPSYSSSLLQTRRNSLKSFKPTKHHEKFGTSAHPRYIYIYTMSCCPQDALSSLESPDEKSLKGCKIENIGNNGLSLYMTGGGGSEIKSSSSSSRNKKVLIFYPYVVVIDQS